MKLLQEAIEKRGIILNDNILKVDSFMNHQIDPQLMFEIGKEFADHYRNQEITKIVTIESSGIAPAVFTGLAMNLPVVFLKKSEPSTMIDPVYVESFSFTKNRKYTLCMESSMLEQGDKILFIDDFLANGQAFESFESLMGKCGATIAGIGIVIEKSFQKGRKTIEDKGYDIYSLARIQSMENGKINWID